MSMPDASGVATPTDAERQLAEYLGYRLQAAVYAVERQQCRDAIAQALADQRAKYEAVADDLAKHTVEPESEYDMGFISGLDCAATAIRRVTGA